MQNHERLVSVSSSQTAMHVHLFFVFTAITPDTGKPFMRMAADTSHLCLKVRSTLHVTGACSVFDNKQHCYTSSV